MKLYHDATPGDVGVPVKLYPQEAGVLQGSYPYESAVQELKLLITDCCPQRKLECIGESLTVCFFFFTLTRANADEAHGFSWTVFNHLKGCNPPFLSWQSTTTSDLVLTLISYLKLFFLFVCLLISLWSICRSTK